MAFERAPALEGLFVSTAAAIARSPNHKGLSVPVSAFLCAILWTAVLLWLAAPIGGANAIVALIGGVLAGGIWYEERAAKLVNKQRDEWMRGRRPRPVRWIR